MAIAVMRRALKLALIGVVITTAFLSLSVASASSANISRAYKSTLPIKEGSIVSLSASRAGYVEPATPDNASRLVGVTLSARDSLVALDASEGTVQVATTGTVTTLVSDLGGNIKVGDPIAISPFGGIGMKATSADRVVGLAQDSFNTTSGNTATTTVEDKTGKSQKVRLGFVRLALNINLTDNLNSQPELSSLQRISKSLTGHTVSTTKIVIAIVVISLALSALLTLIYSAVYGSIISVGRNPLGATAVYRSLAIVLLMALMTAGVAGVSVYLLLR